MRSAMGSLPRNQIIVSDALEALRTLPSESVDSCLTSPPYFRLRDYGRDDQLGMETHVDAWADNLHAVLREVQRVLVPTGTLWLNLGDTYANHVRQGAPAKSLLLGPERVAQRLQADGWILRNKVIWAKPNPMPTSTRDRLTATHEVIYMLSKQARYFFDLDAVRQPHRSPPGSIQNRRSTSKVEAWRGPNADSTTGLSGLKARGMVGHPLGKNPGDVWIIGTAPGRGSHHATFPVSLARRAVQAGTPERRCGTCKKPWSRPLRREGRSATRLDLAPTCEHQGGGEPGLVLDPFMGSGTTALVAEQLQRHWIGIELNDQFAHEASERLRAA